MTRSDMLAINRRWPHRGGTLEALLTATPEDQPCPAPAADEIVARVEAVSICSSDIKIVRMGAAHPLFADAAADIDTVLGHEVCLRVVAVGAQQAARFHPGQRLGLQPALRVAGKRRIIGMDLPGGFAQLLRLGPDALDGYVMDVPETLPAAAIALLEPYGCVERAWRPNARTALQPGGRALIVSAEGSEGFDLADVPDWAEITCVGPAPAWLADRPARLVDTLERLALAGESFDDILALGSVTAQCLTQLCALMANGALLLQARSDAAQGLSQLDPARIHYDQLAFLGTRERRIETAFEPARQRYDARPGGVVLVHGAGGAMGRIHVHRLLQLEDGPATIIASSRKGKRLADLTADFGDLAARAGKRLVVTDTDSLADTVARLAPQGLSDAVVVAPDPGAVRQAAGWLGHGGLLAVFAGFPYGERLSIDLSRVALDGLRLTGSTGCSLADMEYVLARVSSGQLDLSANIAAVGGLDALPQALKAVADGSVSGKIVIYPQRPDLPLAPADGWTVGREAGLTG